MARLKLVLDVSGLPSKIAPELSAVVVDLDPALIIHPRATLRLVANTVLAALRAYVPPVVVAPIVTPKV